MSGVGISTITPPELESVKAQNIVKFQLAYEKYFQQVTEYNRARSASQRVPPTGIKACVSAELLIDLTVLRTFPECSTVSDVTDQHVKQWISSRSKCSIDDMDSQVSDALRRVRFKFDRADPQGSALQFFADVTRQLRRNRVENAIDQASKVIIRDLIPKLEPRILRDTIRSSHKFWDREKKYDFHFFKTKVIETAVESAKYSGKRDSDDKESNPSQAGGGERNNKRVKQNHNKDSGNSSTKETKKTEAKDSSGQKAKKGSSKRSKEEWTDACLNTDCSGIHPVKDCPITSDEQKKQFLKEYYENREKQNNGKKVASISKDISAGNIGDGRWAAMIDCLVPCTALGDYGSDDSAMPRTTVNQLIKMGRKVSVEEFKHPIELHPAVKVSIPTITSSAKGTFDITLSLPCGPLRLRNISFFVIDQEMDEIILGRPLLKCLGFNLDHHFEKVREKFNDADISALMQDAINDCSLSATEESKVASLKPYRGLWYNQFEHDPISLPESAGANMGVDKEADVQKAFSEALSRAKASGMSAHGLQIAHDLLTEFRSIFRIKLGPDPPAKVEAMQIRLKENHRPVRATQRRYATPQRKFIEATVRRLESVGAVYSNPKSRWASPALAVAKQGPENFRFTVDLRGPNKETIPLVSAMPDLESLLQSTAASTAFAKFDMCHAYWQIPLHPESQECMSIQTPLGVFTPTRTLQGSTDAGNHFQSVTANLFIELETILQWLDDFLMHEASEAQLLKLIRRFFEICRKHGLKLHAEKMELFLREAKFCGRIIDSQGVRFDPKGLQTLMHMRPPERAGGLQQFLCATNWMRNSIPCYSKTVAPLHSLMESCYTKVQKRTKRAVRNLSLSGLWGANQDSAFKQIQFHLAQAIKLAHPKSGYTLCLFSDASETHWSAVLTQVPNDQRKLEVEEQSHEPLSFLSGSFTNSSARWSTVEKEAFAVVEAISRLDHLTSTREIALYTDHANLIYIFDPYGQNPGVAKHTANKLFRWALKLSSYRYVIEHLSGERNVWADILTRWAVKSNEKVQAVKIAAMLYAPINTSTQTHYDWPTLSDITASQLQRLGTVPDGFQDYKGVIQNDSKIIWIPDGDELLRLRLLIAAHTGRGGHRGIEPTKAAISQNFWWKTLEADVAGFCKSCLHCLCTASGKVVPRPLVHSLHASKPNKIIHFDYCYIGPSDTSDMYLLIIKDDFSSYVWLLPYDTANTSNTVDALMKWFAAFGVVPQWVSDQGTHFKNDIMEALRKKLRGSHHFTLPYCPWSNGTVEVVCRELLRMLRALASEFQMPFKFWPTIVPIIQSVLNNTVLKRLQDKCPLTAFTALPSDNPLLSIKAKTGRTVRTMSIEMVRAKQVLQMEKTLAALEDMHKNINESTSKARERRINSHNERTHIRSCNFDEGDFVLRALAEKKHEKKLALRWKGPYRVSKVFSDFLFELEDLRAGTKHTVHGTRIKFFRNSDFEITTDCIEQLTFQENEYCVVQEFKDIRAHKGEMQLLTVWKGFDDEEPAWEDIVTMREDVPAMVRDFIQDIKDSGTRRQKRLADNC